MVSKQISFVRNRQNQVQNSKSCNFMIYRMKTRFISFVFFSLVLSLLLFNYRSSDKFFINIFLARKYFRISLQQSNYTYNTFNILFNLAYSILAFEISQKQQANDKFLLQKDEKINQFFYTIPKLAIIEQYLHLLIFLLGSMLQKISKTGIYPFLILANILYLLAHGIQPITYSFKLIIYNFLIFLLIGFAVFFKLSYHLHSWFVKGQGDVKQKTKIKLKQCLNLAQRIIGFLRPGNQKVLVYIYLTIAVWDFVSIFIPGLLMGLFIGLIYELKTFINDNYSQQWQSLKQWFWNQINQVMNVLPRYKEELTQQTQTL